jgi:hypothetical protein
MGDEFQEADVQEGAALYDMGEAEVEDGGEPIDETMFEPSPSATVDRPTSFGFEDSEIVDESTDGDMMYGNVDTAPPLAAFAPKTDGISTADVNRRCAVEGYQAQGIIRFVGPHATKKGARVGIELDEAVGRNNGSIAVSRGIAIGAIHALLHLSV